MTVVGVEACAAAVYLDPVDDLQRVVLQMVLDERNGVQHVAEHAFVDGHVLSPVDHTGVVRIEPRQNQIRRTERVGDDLTGMLAQADYLGQVRVEAVHPDMGIDLGDELGRLAVDPPVLEAGTDVAVDGADGMHPTSLVRAARIAT